MSRRALCWFLALSVWAGTAGAGPVRVEAHREGDAVVVEASADVHADPALAWEVLTAYDHYAEFVPDLRTSRVVERGPGTAVVEQTGVAGLFFYRIDIEVRLAVSEEPYAVVRSRAISGNFREMSGVYRLEPDGDGVRFLYSGRIVPSFTLPPLIGLPAVRASVQRQFGGLVREIERRATARGAAK